MNITPLRPKWGLVVEATKDEVFSAPDGHWRNLGYEHDLILFKGLGKLTNAEYYRLISYFGKPWEAEEYKYSKEIVDHFDEDGVKGCLSRFSNLTSKLGTRKLPWHSDIPNSGAASFPWRSLYMTKNPNPQGGLTSWMNLMLDNIQPTPEELDLFNRMSVTNQSWLRVDGDGFITQDFVKADPVTGRKSIRANYFVAENSGPTAWIKNTYIDGIEVDNMATLGPLYKKLSLREDLTYTHQWDLYDFIIYNNCSFMHRRTKLDLNDGEEREFIRANIHHTLP